MGYFPSRSLYSVNFFHLPYFPIFSANLSFLSSLSFPVYIYSIHWNTVDATMNNLVVCNKPNCIEEDEDGVDELHTFLPATHGLAVQAERLGLTACVNENNYL